MGQDFVTRFEELAGNCSALCLGIDPAAELLRGWGLPDDVDGLRRFCGTIMEAAGERVALFKPQSAFFERFGPDGMREMRRLVDMIHDRGALALIDCKRNDIGHTLEAYGAAMLGRNSAFGGDAMTLTAYFGFGALLPVLGRAVEEGAGIFVVVRSSNPEGAELQNARLPDGTSIADRLADQITEFNAKTGRGIGPVGAVMGATIEGAAAETLARLPHSLLLAPGIGAQGASFSSLRRSFGAAASRAIPSISRGILMRGPTVDALRSAIEQACDEARAISFGASPPSSPDLIRGSLAAAPARLPAEDCRVKPGNDDRGI